MSLPRVPLQSLESLQYLSSSFCLWMTAVEDYGSLCTEIGEKSFCSGVTPEFQFSCFNAQRSERKEISILVSFELFRE